MAAWEGFSFCMLYHRLRLKRLIRTRTVDQTAENRNCKKPGCRHQHRLKKPGIPAGRQRDPVSLLSFSSGQQLLSVSSRASASRTIFCRPYNTVLFPDPGSSNPIPACRTAFLQFFLFGMDRGMYDSGSLQHPTVPLHSVRFILYGTAVILNDRFLCRFQ